MLARLLPAEVACAEAFADRDEGALFPQERAVVAAAVESRRREFVTARECARSALASLGLPAGPIPRDRHGAPRWPRGVVGSITHCDGYRGSAVAWLGAVGAVGIDAEPNADLPPRVLGSIAADAELDLLRGMPASGVHWERLLFSAKECIYKAWYPRTGERLGFGDALVRLQPDGLFAARVARAGRGVAELEGRWLCERGLLLTALVLA
ncbi:MAG TPA: 4'-phosphopantetheinyl transferase superfamily protein [Solirubrobacterales bacterium]|nr:4'-phosphopantetheinyl transferase superfamily protein [Solirubrobacterales bacterium]